jgi:LysR family cyn operon transcriptional activator
MYEAKHLEAFAALARTMHFGRAAKSLGISKSAMSEHIRLLEEDVGGPLVVRSNRTVSLTALGETFLPDAVGLLKLMNNAKAHCRALLGSNAGKLRLGVEPSSVGGGLFSRILRAAAEKFPGLDLEISEGSPVQLLDDLLGRRIDCMVSLTLGLECGDDLFSIPLLALRAMLIAPKSIPLADAAGNLRREALAGLPFSLFINSARMPHRINAIFGFEGSRLVLEPTLLLMLESVNAGNAFSVIPETDTGMLGSNTQSLPLPGMMFGVRAVRLAGTRSPVVSAFFGMLRELCPESAYRKTVRRIRSGSRLD